jgi:hypothetical protein
MRGRRIQDLAIWDGPRQPIVVLRPTSSRVQLEAMHTTMSLIGRFENWEARDLQPSVSQG